MLVFNKSRVKGELRFEDIFCDKKAIGKHFEKKWEINEEDMYPLEDRKEPIV